ncbi:MAG: hypothetical protein COW84_00765 [Gammaproteobacteria bacterium CG22_combo_CG10-13_8_21_14_all_40_8]|nr:MAG: hypothetical protein COW84_00765 [Gammaproteobacteria bacterium CG22_combo_CG10-13_8_21_14_all_40_8]
MYIPMASDFMYEDPEDKNIYNQWKDWDGLIKKSIKPKSCFKYNSNLATAVIAIRKKLLQPRTRHLY